MSKIKASCKKCGRMLEVNEMVQVEAPNTHYIYFCKDCYEEMQGYYNSEVDAVQKKSKSVSITTGIELEICHGLTSAQYHKLRRLMMFGFLPSEDGTCEIEYKSPVWRNLNGVAKLLYSCIEENEITLDSSVGTHVNVWSEELDVRDYDRIRNYYNILFKPFYDEVCNTKHEKLFGRRMNTWCDEFSNSAHCCLVNTETSKRNHPRLELRICKYKNNAQFMNCLRFANDWMKTILVNFSQNYISDSQAAAMGKTSEWASAHNKHKAEVTAQKLVKVYNKYLQKAQAL